MDVRSPAFENGKPIPTKYAHKGVTGGKNVSVPVAWSAVPAGVQSIALSIVDPHPVAKNWVHWLVINLPANTASLPEGASGAGMPPPSLELYNSYGYRGYGGPEPPKGSGPHPYEITVYALRCQKLDLTPTTTLEGFRKAVDGHVMASGTVTGIYER